MGNITTNLSRLRILSLYRITFHQTGFGSYARLPYNFSSCNADRS